jgi:hypothetical protein
MIDFDSLTIRELEAQCPPDMVEFLRRLWPKAKDYRDAIVRFISKPKLPIRELLAAIQSAPEPTSAWREVLSICSRSAAGAPWESLITPDINRDIKNARNWLTRQLQLMKDASGIYLGLDTLNMRGGRGKNVEIGGSVDCDPLQDSTDWLFGSARKLQYGTKHLIRGLYELNESYSQDNWCVRDDKVARGNYRSFAEYTLFLSYSGIVLGHACKRLSLKRTFLVIWGFHDGDMFLLGRRIPSDFVFLCR